MRLFHWLVGKPRRSRFHDDGTRASNPGEIRLSADRFYRLEPLTGGLPASWVGQFATRKEFEQMLDEHLRLGDSRAACVISVEPLLVGAYTDELDCIVLLSFPDWLVRDHDLKVGRRLLTVNTYGRGQRVAPDLVPGQRQLGRWVNFYPIIAEFVSDDIPRISARKAGIAEEEWRRCEQMGFESLQRFPNRWRNGSPFWSGKPEV
jgi:hypothetical protein